MPSGRPLDLPAELLEAFEHSGMQSVRRTFARMGGAPVTGASLDRRRVTRPQAQAALRASTVGLTRAFSGAFAEGRARVKGQPRRAVDMLTYLMQHDAHHRGQICALARDLGHEFAGPDITRIWGWKKLPERVRVVSDRAGGAASSVR